MREANGGMPDCCEVAFAERAFLRELLTSCSCATFGVVEARGAALDSEVKWGYDPEKCAVRPKTQTARLISPVADTFA